MSIQKEVVYETEDFPEDDRQILSEEIRESDDVEKIYLNVDAVLKNFKGRLLSAEHVVLFPKVGKILRALDFSDSLTRKRIPGYASGSYVFEVVGREDESETLEQKFHRLRCELDELYERVHNQEMTKSLPTVNEESVVEMIETIKALQSQKIQHSTPQSVETQRAKGSPTAAAQTVESTRIAAFETRLKRIEDLIGASDAIDDFTKKLNRIPLTEVVEDIRMRVNLLNPTHVDGLCSRINQVVSKLQQLEEKKQEKSDSDFEEKVNSLYEMMKKWDNACVGLSSAVQRMQSLQKLHEQAQQFSTKLSLLVGIRSQVLKSVESENMALFEFRQQMADSVKKAANDIEKLEERLKVLNP